MVGHAFIPLAEVIAGKVRPLLLVLLCGAGMLLLIACVNIASLLLVRTESRRREFAVRTALGASRTRLIRQFATEGLVLVAAGCTLGLIFALWAMRLLLMLIPTEMIAGMPYLHDLGLNARVLAYAGVISLLATALFSIIPIAHLSLTKVGKGLAEGSRGSAGLTWRRLGSKLVVLELATAMVLLVSAGLFGKSFYRLLQVSLGFAPDHLAVLEVGAPTSRYAGDAQAVALGRQVIGSVGNLPGVKSVALTSRLPVSGNGNTDWIRFEGRPYNGEHHEVNQRDVSSDYFMTLQTKLLRGRFFTDAEDGSKPRVVVINQALARQYFPGEDPIGKRIGDTELTPGSLKEIIGVVDDLRESSLDVETWPTVYYPFNQSPDTYFMIVVRTSQSEGAVLPTLMTTLRKIDSGIVAAGGATMIDLINDSPTAYLHRSSAWLVGGFAATALLLGVIGLYGVITYSVSQRTREIGVRIALGAPPGRVYWLIMKEAGWLIASGVVIGLIWSMAAATLIRSLLFGVESWDPPTLTIVIVVLGASGLLASYLPARRAASTNPVEALRAE